MSRSGYHDDCDSNYLYLYRGMIERTIRGKRSQAFLRDLAAAMDAMPEKKLIAHELVTATGECCAIGVVCKARSIDTSKVDIENADEVGALVGIARSLAAEIEYENDEVGRWDETPERRWTRMRKWVSDNLIDADMRKGDG